MKFNYSSISSLDHMTHINNLDSIMRHGLLAHDNPYKCVDISNLDVNSRRKKQESVYGKSIHEYVPFYFNPRNAMMYKNREQDIIILGFDKKLLLKSDVLFTDKNAAASTAKFYNNIDDLEKINVDLLVSSSWNNEPEIVKQTMMAEVLVPKSVCIEDLVCIYCKDEMKRDALMRRNDLSSIKIIVEPEYFFLPNRRVLCS